MHASWGVAVTQQEGHDVVVPVVPGLGDQAEVGRVGPAVGIACSLLIGIGPGQGVTQAACPSEVLSILARTILHLFLQHKVVVGSSVCETGG